MKLAGIFARHWDVFAGAKPYLLNAAHHRAAEAVRACRTAALGAEVYECPCCKRKRLRYHSCNHRACTQCGKHKQHEWSQAQEAKLLDTDYYLLTFTLPAELRVTCYKQQQWFYGIMFDAVSDTLKALDLKHKRVLPDGVFNPDTLGFTAVLHTWTREMQYHPHIHVVMPGLSLLQAPDGVAGQRHPLRAMATLSVRLVRSWVGQAPGQWSRRHASNPRYRIDPAMPPAIYHTIPSRLTAICRQAGRIVPRARKIHARTASCPATCRQSASTSAWFARESGTLDPHRHHAGRSNNVAAKAIRLWLGGCGSNSAVSQRHNP